MNHKPPAGTVEEREGDRVEGSVGIESEGCQADGCSRGGVFGDRVRGGIGVRDEGDVELIEMEMKNVKVVDASTGPPTVGSSTVITTS